MTFSLVHAPINALPSTCMWTFVFKLGSMAPLLWRLPQIPRPYLCHAERSGTAGAIIRQAQSHWWLVHLTRPLEGHISYFVNFSWYLAHSSYLKICTEWIDKGIRGTAETQVLAFHCRSFDMTILAMERLPWYFLIFSSKKQRPFKCKAVLIFLIWPASSAKDGSVWSKLKTHRAVFLRESHLAQIVKNKSLTCGPPTVWWLLMQVGGPGLHPLHLISPTHHDPACPHGAGAGGKGESSGFFAF